MPTQPADLLAYALLASFALGLCLTGAIAVANRLRSSHVRHTLRNAEAPAPLLVPHEERDRQRVGAQG